ncbi:FUSC family protein [Brachymonas sp. G13]|uniref:FUSC family protein n=1 Tax=Brachymonas TaxID=28219 RepID=UPI0016A60515|nr:FUSC family protein [Brachymonas sp. J145]MEE1654148.1 FUSC family protein [Brachymonas sp. J145]NLX16155.1 FUSC family protein [Ramlibacter sp.]
MTFWQRLSQLVRTEWYHLTDFKHSDRPWQLPFAAALASGLPLAVGAWFGHVQYGVLSSLGGLVFLYIANLPLAQRMVVLMVCAFAMAASFGLAQMGSALHPLATPVVLTFLTLLVGMVTRFYRLPPPGSFFFIMVASIGAYLPVNVELIPLRVGLVFMGSMLALLMAFFYSLWMMPRLPPPQPAPSPHYDFQYVVYDSVLIAVFVGLALVVAELMGLRSAYWAPVSCIAIMQNVTMRAVWNKQVHRILGTAAGMVLTWLLLTLQLNPWSLFLILTTLSFIIEMLVVRHYGLAVIFITPLTILLAEAGANMQLPPDVIIQARLIDIVVGSVIGVVGGVFLHNLTLREWVSRHLFRRPMPPTQRHQA